MIRGRKLRCVYTPEGLGYEKPKTTDAAWAHSFPIVISPWYLFAWDTDRPGRGTGAAPLGQRLAGNVLG